MNQNFFIQLTLAIKSKDPQKVVTATDFFISQGFALGDISSLELKSLLKVSVFVRSAKEEAKVQKAAKQDFKKPWVFESKILQQEDWLTKWQDGYKIFAIGKKFSIVPQWKKEEYRGRKIPIYLNPEGAFGSGTHQTTKLMVALMEGYFKNGESFLDVGMGTGVLSIVAHHLGATTIKAFDHDLPSVKTAKLNARLNQVKGIDFSKQDVFKYHDSLCYDIVAANMISKILEESQDILFARVKKGGYLIISGIVRKNFEGFLKRFKSKRFKRVKTVYARSWGACVYKRII